MKIGFDIAAETTRGRTNSAFAKLYEAHAPAAMRLAVVLTGDRESAEDLVQDAFVRLIGTFRDRRRPDAFQSYLRMTIINLARTRWRRQARQETAPPVEMTVADHAPGVALGEMLWGQICRLPPRQRAALYLRYYEDQSLQEIAHSLGCSVGAAKSLLRYALKNLRNHEEVR